MPADPHTSMSSTPPDLSIVVVSYNTRGLLLDCLRSVFEQTGAIRFDVVVVDNDSHDGTVPAVRAQFPGVKVIANPDNRGFSKAVNQALDVSAGRHVLLLNSDTRVQNRAVEKMVDYLDRHSDVGAVSCKQWTGDGQLYQSCFPFPSIRDHLRYAAFFQRIAPDVHAAMAAARAIDCRVSQDVDWVNGACLMVRRALLERCGGLDEGFFMYFEDVDLCLAIRRHGFRVRHLAEADIVHLIGGSSGRERARLNMEWEFSRIRYIEKHFPLVKRWLMKWWIAGGAGVRLLNELTRRQSTSGGPDLQPYLSVWRRLVGARRAESARWAAGAGTSV